MSRFFDGTDDVMTYASVPSALNVTDTHTFVAVVRQMDTDDTSWNSYIETHTSGAAVSATHGRRSNGMLYWTQGTTSTGGANGVAFDDTSGWAVTASRKAAGGGDITHSRYIFGGSPVHTAFGTGLIAAASITGGTLYLGGGPSGDYAGIRLAAAALFTRVLSDSEVNGIATAATTQSIYDLTPVWLVDDADAFAADYMNNLDRTAITGTADDADDPSGWVYGLGSGDYTGTVPAAGLATASGPTPVTVPRPYINISVA